MAEATAGRTCWCLSAFLGARGGKLYNTAAALKGWNASGADSQAESSNYAEFYEARNFCPATRFRCRQVGGKSGAHG